MRGPVSIPVPSPREQCKTQACVERREESAVITLWAMVIALLVFFVLALVVRARVRAREREKARREQAVHDRAQEELKRLFEAPKAKDEK